MNLHLSSNKLVLIIFNLLIFLFSTIALSDEAIDDKVKKITSNLRCMTCQNQTIYDSDTDFSKNIRQIVRQKLIDNQTAAIMVEPILGEGGIKVVPNQCLEGLRDLCDKKKILLILDEIQCGIGRTGKFFYYQWSKMNPDILTTAKGIGGGFPIGACLVSNEVSKGMKSGSHGSTFGGNPLACSVANKVVDIISKKSFLFEVNKNSEFFFKKLEEIKNKYNKLITEIRGKGYLLGIKCRINNNILIEKLRTNGLLTIGACEDVVRFLPPLNVKKKELKIALEIIKKTCQEISKKKY